MRLYYHLFLKGHHLVPKPSTHGPGETFDTQTATHRLKWTLIIYSQELGKMPLSTQKYFLKSWSCFYSFVFSSELYIYELLFFISFYIIACHSSHILIQRT